MFNNLKKSFIYILGITAAALLSQSNAIAGHADQDNRAMSGTVSCGGNFFIRKGGKELNTSNYIFRNYSDDGVINIDRIRVFNAHGVKLFDSNTTGMPAFLNNVLSAADTELDPHQTAHLKVDEMIPFQGKLTRPIQTIINWSSNKKTLTLEMALVRVNADRDPATGEQGRQRGRHLYECRTTELKKHKKHRKD